MKALVTLLSVLGFIAVLRQVLISALRVLKGGVDRYVAGQVADTRARHGDLTGMREAERAAASARQRRRAAVAVLAAWFALLIAPPFTPLAPYLYAAYSALWLLPARRKRA